MKKLAHLIVKYKWIVLVVTAVIVVFSILGTADLILMNKINSDMISYLPEEFETTEGLRFLQKNFDIKGDIMIVVEGSNDDEELENKVETIRNIDGVTQFVWAKDLEEMKDFNELLDLFNIQINIDTSEIEGFLKHAIDPEDPQTKYNYVFLIMTDYNPSTNEANTLLNSIKDEISDRPYAVAGMTETSYIMMTEMINELPKYLIYAAVGLFIILLLTTSSYIEPLILLISLGMSVLVNMGTNMIFKDISIISFATTSILQLALTMDYAVFYMHIYKEKRMFNYPVQATEKAMPAVASSIVASAFTTIGGFAALYFMKFELGADLANVLIKGVLLSLLTVLIVQPIFVLLFDRYLLKTQHSQIKINVKPLARFAVKERFLFIVMAIIMVVPLFLAQNDLEYSYFETYEMELETPQQQKAYELGNQLIFAVPVQTQNGKSHQEFIEEIKLDSKVSGVMSAFTAMDAEPEEMIEYLENPITGSFFITGYAASFFKKVDGKWYTLYTIGMRGSAEDEQAFASYENLSKISNSYFENTYKLGMVAGVYDMRAVTPRDFMAVTLISVGVIMLILMFLYRSLRKAGLLVLIIELGIWINLAISFILGENLNFMVYIIISAVQLGCTVDYAILVANSYEKTKWNYSKPTDAAIAATSSAFPAVISSAAIIITACMSMFVVSDNIIIKQLTGMLARGALISSFLVLTLQTGVMVYFRKFR